MCFAGSGLLLEAGSATCQIVPLRTPNATTTFPAEQRGPQEGDEVREPSLGRHGESHSVFRPHGSAAAAALQTWLGEWRGCLWMFPSLSVRSTHRGDVGRVSPTDMSYFDWICLYWLRSELEESARAWKAVLPTCCRPHGVFILSCNVIAPLSHPSKRWNGFLPRAFFLARNHPKCRIDTPISMFWNVDGHVSSRSILRPARRHGMTSWETTRTMQGEERYARWWMAGTRGLRDAMILEH